MASVLGLGLGLGLDGGQCRAGACVVHSGIATRVERATRRDTAPHRRRHDLRQVSEVRYGKARSE